MVFPLPRCYGRGRASCWPLLGILGWRSSSSSLGHARVERCHNRIWYPAGVMLGKIHAAFRDYAPRRTTTPRWLEFDVESKRRKFTRYLERIHQRPNLDAFDRSSLPLIQERLSQLHHGPALARRLVGLNSQVVHGDYSRLNILFEGQTLRAVIDFGPPESFLRSYELGRIAFPPEHFDTEDWLARALALIRAYATTHDIPRADLLRAADAWLLQLLRSTYGLEQHYEEPHDLQAALDIHWFERARACTVMLGQLDTIRDELERV